MNCAPPPPGLPPGVVNMVYGVGPTVGEAIVKHPLVPIISFTGSTLVGQRIQSVTAPYIKRLSLEVLESLNSLHQIYNYNPFSSQVLALKLRRFLRITC